MGTFPLALLTTAKPAEPNFISPAGWAVLSRSRAPDGHFSQGGKAAVTETQGWRPERAFKKS